MLLGGYGGHGLGDLGRDLGRGFFDGHGRRDDDFGGRLGDDFSRRGDFGHGGDYRSSDGSGSDGRLLAEAAGGAGLPGRLAEPSVSVQRVRSEARGAETDAARRARNDAPRSNTKP